MVRSAAAQLIIDEVIRLTINVHINPSVLSKRVDSNFSDKGDWRSPKVILVDARTLSPMAFKALIRTVE
jgi:hypothetical protein